jgi:aspartate/methionine/tyrosine aminotransferase
MFSKRTDWKLQENAYTRALRVYRQSGKPILDLTASNPTTCGFHYDEPAILAALHDRAALQYDPDPKGMAPARAAVAAYYREMNPGADGRVDIDPENLILTTGTSEAYSFLFRLLCEPGDEIAIAQPSYPLFEFLATIQDVKLQPFRLIYDHGWQIDFHALEQAITSRTRAILLVHPNNPTGHFVRRVEADQLQSICAERGLALVVDEVFLDYRISASPVAGEAHGTFAASDRALTFVLSGISKIAALPQMKIGWIAASGPDALVRDAMARLEIISDTYLSLSAPLQRALPALLAQRTKMQPQLTDRVTVNLRTLDGTLAKQKLVSRLAMEVGWYAVLRVPAVQSDEDLAIRLLERHGVLVQPGHFYDFAEDGYLIVSLLTPGEDFKEGIGRLLACVAG